MQAWDKVKPKITVLWQANWPSAQGKMTETVGESLHCRVRGCRSREKDMLLLLLQVPYPTVWPTAGAQCALNELWIGVPGFQLAFLSPDDSPVKTHCVAPLWLSSYKATFKLLLPSSSTFKVSSRGWKLEASELNPAPEGFCLAHTVFFKNLFRCNILK